ncbi:MAG: sodium:proton antiporter [candidate division WOR-3 bacterium]
MLSVWAALPFIALLVAIGVLPVTRYRWWERYFPLVALVSTLPVIFGYLAFRQSLAPVQHTIREYFSFICLIGSLYIIAGGIRLRIVGPPKPLYNVLMLLAGALISNIIGTTGASMLLIRPFLNINRHRMAPYLVVFFIFIVANIGGAMTPIGDPPLFLGYVNGVPFFWLAGRVWFVWLVTLGIVLAAFYWLDRRNQACRSTTSRRMVIHLEGWRNLALLAVILVAVFAHTPVRELIMVGAALASYVFTSEELHRRNRFSFGPIREVSILFAAIFVTMAPVLELLEQNAARLHLRTSLSFFWGTGLLSGFLDNAPTYRTFFQVALSLCGGDVNSLLQLSPDFVVAVSLGAVFFGAFSYIGNGPNFMIKSIAEHRRFQVPHFFSYITHYSIPILLPTFVVVSLLLLIL